MHAWLKPPLERDNMFLIKHLFAADRKKFREVLCWIAGGVLLSLFVCGQRYLTGAHYLPVAVQLPSGLAGEVWLRSPFGTVKRLESMASKPDIHIPRDYEAGPVSSIIVVGVSAGDAAQVKILLGESLGGATAIPVRDVLIERERDFKGAFRCEVDLCRSSLSELPAKTFNWAGDLLFLTYCGIVTLWLIVLAKAFWRLVGRGRGFDTGGTEARGRLAVVCRSVCLAVCLGFCCTHAWASLLGVIGTRDAFCGCVLLILFICAGTTFLLREGSGSETPRPRQWMYTVLVALGLVACRAAIAGRAPWNQAGDYATYLRLGGLILNGDWASLNSGYHANLIQTMRALLIGYPAAYFGNHATAFTFAANNLILSLLFWWLVFSDERAAPFRWRLISAICGMLYSDLFFGSYLCRHDVPALLLLVAVSSVFCTIVFRDFGTNSGEGAFGPFPLMLLLGVLLGLLEVQRSLLPFVAIGGSCIIPAAVHRARVGAVWLGSLFVAFVVCACVQSCIESQTGKFNFPGILDSINSAETGQLGYWKDLEPWLLYYRDEPSDWGRLDFFIRKMLYEKVVQFPVFLSNAVSKLSVLAGCDGVLRNTGAVLPGEQFPANYFVPYFGVKKCFGNLIYLVLLACMGARCVSLRVNRMRPIEMLPLMFGLCLVVLVVCLGEAAEQYDLFLVISLSLNMRSVLANGKETSPASVIGVLPSMLRPAALGVVVLAGCCGVLWVSGMVVQRHRNWLFSEPHSGVDAFNCEVLSGRLAYGIHVPHWGGEQKVAMGRFLFPRRDFAGDRCRFILSADQRRKGTLYTQPAWLSSGLRVIVRVGGVIAFDGVAESLSMARFLSADISDAGETVEIQVEVVAAPEPQPVHTIEDVSVVVEYVH